MVKPGDRVKILLISRNLPPLVGGMERLIQNLAEGLSDYTDLTVIGPRNCSQYLPGGTRVREVPSRLGSFLVASTLAALTLRNRPRFDLVIGGSGITAPILRIAALRFGCKSTVLLHGLDIVVDNRLYQSLFVPNLKRIDFVVANSDNTRKLAIGCGIEPCRIAVINPGVEEVAPPNPATSTDFRQKLGIPFNRYLLFVGRMTKRKGLSGFMRDSLPQILERIPDIGLVVVGDDPSHGLDGRGELGEVHAALGEMALQDKVRFTGQITDEDLDNCYRGAEVLVLPLIDVPGDVEGFGMVAIEAAARGTPTVAFRLGGVADAISRDNGELVSAGDYCAFTDAVCRVATTGNPDSNRCLAHSVKFHWRRYHARVRDIIWRITGMDSKVSKQVAES